MKGLEEILFKQLSESYHQAAGGGSYATMGAPNVDDNDRDEEKQSFVVKMRGVICK